MNCLVLDAFLKVKGVSTHDVGHCEGRAQEVAGQDLGRGGVDKAEKCVSNFDGNVFQAKEPGVVAAMPDKELMLNTGVWAG